MKVKTIVTKTRKYEREALFFVGFVVWCFSWPALKETLQSLWIVTKKDGDWGVQARSSFAP